MAIATERYANWKAPSEDGAVLVWPAATELRTQVQENQRILSIDQVRLHGVSLQELRQSQRQWIGHSDPNRPIIATGHQTELFHPGVWVKNAVIDEVAKLLSAEAIHFAVDTDEPKHLQLRWPSATYAITDDPTVTSAAWAGLVQGPTPAQVQLLEKRAARIPEQWHYQPLAQDFLASLRRLSMDAAQLPFMLTNAMHELDWELGLRHQAMVTSPIWTAEPYLVFAHHLLSNAVQFAGQYNAALHEYRQANGIKTPGRPMPDLPITADDVEVPFWFDDIAVGKRQRGHILRRGEGLLLAFKGDEFELKPDAEGWAAAAALMLWLRQHHLRLSPRALTLTMFLRLFVVDQWVHGIGGGRYDQVLDALIEKHFAIKPPYFAVATATLFFPGATGRQRVCLSCVAQEAHRAKHAALGAQKMQMVQQIASLPRHSLDRQMIFSEMHRTLRDRGREVMQQWDGRWAAAVKQALEERVLFDRELFYALQSRERLSRLIERVRQQVA